MILMAQIKIEEMQHLLHLFVFLITVRDDSFTPEEKSTPIFCPHQHLIYTRLAYSSPRESNILPCYLWG